MDPTETRILRVLVNYWDGKTPKYPNGPMPPPGDWVAETALARKLGYEVRGSKVLDNEFRAAVESLKKQDFIRRAWTSSESGRWQIRPTTKCINQSDP